MVVWTPDVDSAFRIFSALNNRGLYLSHVDILKAGIVGAVPEAQRAREAYRRRLSSVCGAHTVARSRQRTQWTK
ncbi:MAG: hypothetical protein Q8S73_12850 [Deltaproteobacteria bacterium]|nr:hypothetical protein [Myxococcales bacterium]MDP3214989.1 hypothetical protein [Deltaproteobacteria bacterium]